MKEIEPSSLKVGDLFKWKMTYTHISSLNDGEWIGLVVKKTTKSIEYPLWSVYMISSTRKDSPSVGKINHYNFTGSRLNAKFYLFDKES